MQFKEPAPAPEHDPSALERDDVQVAANRCPFCHDDVRSDDAEAVVCAQCLTRHHDACWVEGGTCSSCGHGVRMRRDEQELQVAARPAASARTRRQLLLIASITLSALFAMLSVTYLFMAQRARHQEEYELAYEEARVQRERAAEEERRALEELRRAELEKQRRAAEAEREAWLRAEAEREARLGAEAEREARLRAEAQAEARLRAEAQAEARAKAVAKVRYERELERVRAGSSARLREAEAKERIEEAAARIATEAERAHALRKAELSLQEGIRLEEAGDLVGAEASYGKAIGFARKDARAYLRRARLREARGNIDGAVFDYERALLDPNLSTDEQAEVDRKLDQLDPIEEDD